MTKLPMRMNVVQPRWPWETQPKDEYGIWREIGARVIFVRENAGLSQADLVRILRQSQTRISHLENGTRGTKMKVLIEFVRKFDITMDFLLMGNLDSGLPQDFLHDVARKRPTIVLRSFRRH